MSTSIASAAALPAELHPPSIPPRPEPSASARPDPAWGSARAISSPTGAAAGAAMPRAASPAAVLAALGGMLALGLCTALGSGTLGAIVPGSILMLASVFGAVLLTAPALLALHQFLQLGAPPAAMVSALAQGLVAGGRVAAGLAPVGLFFAVTTARWPLALLLGFAACGVVTAAVAVGSLRTAEATAAPVGARFQALVMGWAALTTLIALRIGYDVIDLAFRGGLA